MKKTVCMVLLLTLVLGSFSGCGQQETAPAAVPGLTEENPAEASAVQAETQASAAPAFDLWEENPVDDSYRFTWEYREGAEYPESDPYAVFTIQKLPEYVSTWMDGGEILDQQIYGMGSQLQSCYYGWVLFRGTPKQETGWQVIQYEGAPAYCRTVYAENKSGSDQWAVSRSQAALPVPFLTTENIYGPCVEVGKCLIQPGDPGVVPIIAHADFYDRVSGQRYPMTDPGTLEELRSALKEVRTDALNRAMYAGDDFFRDVGWSPVVLTLEDGKQVQFYMMADGGCTGNAWSGSFTLNSAKSIFELFGVPREAAGYGRDADGRVTVRTEAMGAKYDPNVGDYVETPREKTMYYSREGTLEQVDYVTDWAGEQKSCRLLISYDNQGRMSRYEDYQGDHMWEAMDYFYNANGDLEKTTHHYDEAALDTCYHYDEQNRLIAIISFDKDGKEFGPGSQMYFWYDEAGTQYPYQFDQDGSLISGVAPDTPIRRTK